MRSINKITTERLDIEMSGASELFLDLSAKKLGFECSGAGNLNIKGEAENVNAEISGAADMNAGELLTKTFILSLSGSGSANINVSDKLDVEISGTADVLYKGNPEIKQEISGVGTIQKTE